MSDRSESGPDEVRILRVVPETDEVVALCLEGEFDMTNASCIIEESERVLASDKHVILDLSQATFVDSAVINALFHVHRQAGVHDRLAVLQLGTAAIVEAVLEVTGVERVLPRTHTRTEAIATIRQLARSREDR